MVVHIGWLLIPAFALFVAGVGFGYYAASTDVAALRKRAHSEGYRQGLADGLATNGDEILTAAALAAGLIDAAPPSAEMEQNE